MDIIDWSNYYHYSELVIDEVKSTEQTLHLCDKPTGIYFSLGNKWLRWCQEQDFYPHNYKYKYQLSSIGTTNIYILTLHNIYDFIDTYKTEVKLDDDYIKKNIDWEMIIHDGYDGILIPEDILDLRYFRGDLSLEMFLELNNLLSSYDVESLVIWNPKRVKIKLAENILDNNNE
jgi:hypothetical protein